MIAKRPDERFEFQKPGMAASRINTNQDTYHIFEKGDLYSLCGKSRRTWRKTEPQSEPPDKDGHVCGGCLNTKDGRYFRGRFSSDPSEPYSQE